MEKSYKIRIYPNEQQRILIHKTFGCCRFVYNYYLSKREKIYQEEHRTFNFYDCSKDLTKLKNELTWLKEPDKFALVNVLKNLDYAYQRFFTDNNWKHPKYKPKYSHYHSYKTQNGDYDRKTPLICIKGKRIKLPKLGWVKFRDHRVPKEKIINATVIQEPSGKYYVSLCCLDFQPSVFPKTNKNVGIDLGIDNFCTFSDGTIVLNPKYHKDAIKKIQKLHREMDRKQVGSSNWNKSRIKLAKAYEKVGHQKNDYLQKLTTEIVRQNDIVCVESLSVKDMLKEVQPKDHKTKAIIRDSIVELSMFFFVKQLDYKARYYGKKLVKIDRYFPSSQTCNVCGYKTNKTKNTKLRQWICPKCKTHHNRDINAAINILNEGLKQISA